MRVFSFETEFCLTTVSLCSQGIFRRRDWIETELTGPGVGARHGFEMVSSEDGRDGARAAWAAEVVTSVSFYASSELWSLARVSWSAVGSEAIM